MFTDEIACVNVVNMRTGELHAIQVHPHSYQMRAHSTLTTAAQYATRKQKVSDCTRLNANALLQETEIIQDICRAQSPQKLTNSNMPIQMPGRASPRRRLTGRQLPYRLGVLSSRKLLGHLVMKLPRGRRPLVVGLPAPGLELSRLEGRGGQLGGRDSLGSLAPVAPPEEPQGRSARDGQHAHGDTDTHTGLAARREATAIRAGGGRGRGTPVAPAAAVVTVVVGARLRGELLVGAKGLGGHFAVRVDGGNVGLGARLVGLPDGEGAGVVVVQHVRAREEVAPQPRERAAVCVLERVDAQHGLRGVGDQLAVLDLALGDDEFLVGEGELEAGAQGKGQVAVESGEVSVSS